LGDCVTILQDYLFVLQQSLQKTVIPKQKQIIHILKLPVIIDAVKDFKPTHHGVERLGG
jgi:hypothetical protein